MSDMPLQLTVYPASPTPPQSTGRAVNANPTSGYSGDGSQFWGKDGLSFKNVVDAINPLQQLPIVSSIYRAITGDTISSGARIAGGTLYGGPIGFASALFNEIVKTQTGGDVGENLVAMGKGDPATQQADNSYAPPPTNQAAYAAYLHTQKLLA